MADIFTIIGTVISFITLVIGSVLYWVEKNKSYRKQVSLLKQEVNINLKALEFSKYEKEDQLTLDSSIFAKLVGGLKNKTASFCLHDEFKFRIPCKINADKKNYSENIKRCLGSVVQKIIELRLLSSYDTEDGPRVILIQRLNNLKSDLEELKKLLLIKY
jgi:hypothetical protein